MKEFNPLDYRCDACPAIPGEWCDDTWPLHPYDIADFVQTVGFTHEQRALYNLLADQPADGAVPSKEAFADAVRKSGLV